MLLSRQNPVELSYFKRSTTYSTIWLGWEGSDSPAVYSLYMCLFFSLTCSTLYKVFELSLNLVSLLYALCITFPSYHHYNMNSFNHLYGYTGETIPLPLPPSPSSSMAVSPDHFFYRPGAVLLQRFLWKQQLHFWLNSHSSPQQSLAIWCWFVIVWGDWLACRLQSLVGLLIAVVLHGPISAIGP